jgi:MoxR-like ATPase
MLRAARANAALEGREYVLPEDVKLLAPVVWPHRMLLAPDAELNGITTLAVIDDLLADTPLAARGRARR